MINILSIPSELNNNNAYTISKYYYYKSLRGVVEFNEDDLNNYNFNLVDGSFVFRVFNPSLIVSIKLIWVLINGEEVS